MSKFWCKILGIGIIVFFLLVWWSFPSKPEIKKVSPQRAKPGQKIILTVEGVNTHFMAGDYSAWLKLNDDYAIRNVEFTPMNDDMVKVLFYIPANMPNHKEVNHLALIMRSKRDGLSRFPSAIIIQNFHSELPPSSEGWGDLDF